MGPILDQLKPEKERVARQVRNGGVGMPSFLKKLSAVEIDQVAVFVADATRKATGEGSVAAGYQRGERVAASAARVGEDLRARGVGR